MLTLLRNAEVYAPEPMGRRNILIADGRIAAITDADIVFTGVACTVIDLEGRMLCPGFIDNHVHVLGGGGGLGFSSRAPELQTSQIVRHGITTVIGMLGFDATSKSVAALVSKTRAFREDGLSAYCLTGATLEHPVPTLTGAIRTDIAFVDEIIGVGELSISELGYGYDSFGKGAQYVAEAATAGLLTGRLARKSGYTCLQVPPYRDSVLKPMFEVIDRTGLPIKQFVPSHVNQTPEYMKDALAWGAKGGWVDVGANYSPDNNYARAIEPSQAVRQLVAGGVPLESVLVSSDGNGAPPKEERGEGRPKVANYMPIGALTQVFARLCVEHRMPVEQALLPFTANVARAAGLHRKGELRVGMDADITVFDTSLRVTDVYCMGRPMVAAGEVIERGMFDDVLKREFA
jgi:beta-aspartyl-dipeptidase (metallo-type)